MPEFPQIENLRLADRVYSSLRAAILRGDVAAGTELRQEELAAQFGISRTPLREALHRLAVEGLVEERSHRSARVSRFSDHDFGAAYEARKIIEPAAARLAAEQRDGETLAALEEAVRALAGADTLDAQVEANRKFHIALVDGARNAHLSRFIRELWDARIVPFLFIYAQQAQSAERVRRDVRDHEEIARVIASGDGDAAARVVEEHLASARDALVPAGAADQPASAASRSL